MNRSSFAGARDHLVQQLIFFDEQYSMFLDTYFLDQSRERAFMEKFVQRYWRELEGILRQDDNDFVHTVSTLVLVGSSVKLRYPDDGTNEIFTIVFPTESDPDANLISFLSPLGRQLLLGSRGDSLMLESPAGPYPIEIDEVRLTYTGGFPTQTKKFG